MITDRTITVNLQTALNKKFLIFQESFTEDNRKFQATKSYRYRIYNRDYVPEHKKTFVTRILNNGMLDRVSYTFIGRFWARGFVIFYIHTVKFGLDLESKI